MKPPASLLMHVPPFLHTPGTQRSDDALISQCSPARKRGTKLHRAVLHLFYCEKHFAVNWYGLCFSAAALPGAAAALAPTLCWHFNDIMDANCWLPQCITMKCITKNLIIYYESSCVSNRCKMKNFELKLAWDFFLNFPFLLVLGPPPNAI